MTPVLAEIDHRGSLTPVRDQGSRGTCLAHAVTTAHEHVRGDKLPLSVEYLHYFAAGGDSTKGAEFDGTAHALAYKGQPEESNCPYRTSDADSTWHPAPGLSVFKRSSDEPALSLPSIETAIKEGQTVVLGISLPEPFFSPAAPWIVQPEGRVLGLHAVAAIGIGSDQANKLVLIRNSWGSSWADHGHAWLATDFLQAHLKRALLVTDEAN